jgi:hypothetical protein
MAVFSEKIKMTVHGWSSCNQSIITFFLSLLFLAASLFCASRRSVCQNPQRYNGQRAGKRNRCSL